jgi:hypothetical protein
MNVCTIKEPDNRAGERAAIALSVAVSEVPLQPGLLTADI